MCGIAGILLADPRRAPWAHERVREMIDTLRHRGPDGCGTWSAPSVALGHTRLSIIDLSPAGRQPMQDESGRYTLVYNGEIYNYGELRRELAARGCRFRSQTDSEVLLYAYREWGRAALDRFNGMWAFAIWDSERQELFAARDRAGKKPFYHTRDDDGNFYFASEIKAFLTLGFRFAIEPQAAFDFLSQGTYGHLGNRGFFSGVEQLPAAHSMTVAPGNAPAVGRYWALPRVARRDRVPYDAQLVRRFRELLDDAVRLRLRADVPVGTTLSGGLDSSSIAGIVDRITGGAPLHVFTSLYPGSAHDETPYFEAVATSLREVVVHRTPPPEGGFRQDLCRILRHQEEPFGDTSIFAHYYLMECARENGVPVVLSGQGGDELLFGYPSMVYEYLGHLMRHGRIAEATAECNAWCHGSHTGRARALAVAATHAIPLAMRDRVRAARTRQLGRITSTALRERISFRRFERAGDQGSLDAYVGQVFTRFAIPHLVHYDDRNAMAFGVEGRMPFLDHRLVELMFSAQYDALFHRGFTKRILRDACADVLPAAVRERRDKVGFHTPLAAWLRTEKHWVRDVMTPDRVRETGVLDAAKYAELLSRFGQGDDALALPIWRGFIFQLWTRELDIRPLDASPLRQIAA